MYCTSFWSSSGVQGPFLRPLSSQQGDLPILFQFVNVLLLELICFQKKNCGCLFIHKIISTRASMFPYDELIFNAKAENERNFRNIMSTLQVTSLSNSIHARKKRHCRHRLHGFTKGFSSLGLQLYETSLALRLSVSTTISDYLCININYIWYIGKCCLAILSDYISRLRWYTVNLNNWLKVNFCPNVW